MEPAPPRSIAASALPDLLPGETEFVLLCWEGPDPYARVGGLGTRITGLSRALAEAGYRTHLLFVGDPDRPEREADDRLCLYRLCQGLSRIYAGVYDGEEARLQEYGRLAPIVAWEAAIAPAVAAGRRVVVMAEEWQTAGVVIALANRLRREGQRERVLLVWNANNTYGFHRVPWARLREVAAVTTVSRWMRQILGHCGCQAMVIPNGIPPCLLEREAEIASAAAMLRVNLGEEPLLVKVARWTPEKRWPLAVEALANLRAHGVPARLVAACGDADARLAELAAPFGLRLAPASLPVSEPAALGAALAAATSGAEIVSIRGHLAETQLLSLYRAADAVIANSAFEPFGMVGLETMAAGGVAITGATGEEYARPFENALVLESEDPRELEVAIVELLAHPAEGERLRQAGRATASRYTWDRILDLLLRKLRYFALTRGEGG